MPSTLQEFLANATQTGADDIVAGFLRLPEEKRAWTPADTARSAVDQIAECALNNGYVADLIATGVWSAPARDVYGQQKRELAAGDWESLRALLAANTERLAAVIRAATDDSLDEILTTPYGPDKRSKIMAYPWWNMSYHVGQINYLATILGCY